MRLELLLVLALVACGGDKTGTGSGETGTPTAGDDDDTTAACTTLSEGGWSMSGSCFGMMMSATLTLGQDGCSFTFSDWDMMMSAPEGGTVSGTDVTLDWADLGTCAGTTDGTSISGTCDSACGYDMTFDG
jgi:hypothetical protein